MFMHCSPGKIALVLGQIPRERDQRRPRGAAPHSVRRNVRLFMNDKK